MRVLPRSQVNSKKSAQEHQEFYLSGSGGQSATIKLQNIVVVCGIEKYLDPPQSEANS
jgi:hypothetical protein